VQPLKLKSKREADTGDKQESEKGVQYREIVILTIEPGKIGTPPFRIGLRSEEPTFLNLCDWLGLPLAFS
jgi:hypothetical protein